MEKERQQTRQTSETLLAFASEECWHFRVNSFGEAFDELARICHRIAINST
jgi:hypothetical protein